MRRATILLFTLCAFACATPPAGFDPVSEDPVGLNPPARNVELSIPSHGVRLPAYLMLAGGPGPHPAALLLHGYPGNEKNLDLAQSLRRAGISVLFLHYRGAWGAEGDYGIAGQSVDALAALDFLRAHADDYAIDPGRLSVIGHSMGGFTALRTAAADDRVVCAVGIAAANLGARRQPDALNAFAAYSDGLFMLAGWDGAKALAEIGANGDAFDLGRLGPALAGRPVMLVTGRDDDVVPVTVQRDLVARWGAPEGPAVTAVELDGDHAFSNHRIALQRAVVDWMTTRCAQGGAS